MPDISSAYTLVTPHTGVCAQKVTLHACAAANQLLRILGI